MLTHADHKSHISTGPQSRRRIAELERGNIQPMQADRGEILRALLAANGGKMLAKEARQKMHLSESRFSELLAAMEDCVGKKPLHTDGRKNVIFLKKLPRKLEVFARFLGWVSNSSTDR